MPSIDNNIKIGDQTAARRERASKTHEFGLIPPSSNREAAKAASRDGVGRRSTGVFAGSATLTTALVGANNDLKYTAVVPGDAGNDVTVAYVDPPGNDAVLSVDVVGSDVVVNLATDGSSAITSTATQVKNAVNADVDAKELVKAENAPGNTGAGVVTALSETALTGGRE